MKHNFANGKYTIINDNGKLTALRNGEPWERDLCGDNLIYWMLVDFDKMKEQRDELLAACEAMSAHYSGSFDYQPHYVAMARAAITKATNA